MSVVAHGGNHVEMNGQLEANCRKWSKLYYLRKGSRLPIQFSNSHELLCILSHSC